MIYAVWLDEEINSDNEGYVARDAGGKCIGKTNGAKIQHDAAWKLFEYVLKKEYGVELSSCNISRNRWGKSSLEEYPDIHFSLSHNKNMAVCVVSDDEVGIDIETVGRTCSETVWRRMLSDEEYKRLSGMADETERDREFLKYWTLKECYGKAIGTGLSYDYKSVVFDINDVGIACNVPDYRLWQSVVKKNDEEFVISVCKKQTINFTESIEWVKLTGGEAYEA